MSCVGRAKRESCPSSATIVTADTFAIPRSACNAAITARIAAGAVATAASIACSSRAIRSPARSTSRR
jgi:hypothetical protein